MFIITLRLGEGPVAGNENAEDSVSNESTAVEPRARWPATPSGILQRSVDADVHAVASLPLTPTRSQALQSDEPGFIPSTVTLDDPVAAAFVGTAPLTSSPSYDIAPLKLTAPADAVTLITELASVPDPDLLSTAVADAHTLASHPDAPTRACTLNDAEPIPNPSTVTLAAPLPAALVLVALLTRFTSSENASARVTTATSRVAITDSPAPTPLAALPRTDVDDDHADDSHPLAPTRPLLL
jgi:hypothetical protein